MLAIYLAPVYILANIYVLRWIFLWLGSCHAIFGSLTFRICSSIAYILVSTSLLTGFLIKKPAFLHRILKITGNYFLGIFLYAFMIILTADITRLILKYGFHASWIQSRAAFNAAGLICAVLLLGICASGIFHAKNIRVTSYDLTVDKKDSENGSGNLKIVLLADTHFGYNSGTVQAQKLVSKINAQNPDLVCIAGDIFDNEYEAIREPQKLSAILCSIRSKYGVYACWGNHDLNEPILAGFTFSHGDGSNIKDKRMEDFLKESNICLLEDEAVLIDSRFYLVGRKDASLTEKTGETRAAPARLTSGPDTGKIIIFLDHQPKELQKIADAGADLDLSGHTHDGQTFPANLTIRLLWENPCGYLKKGSMHSIVTSGAGVWGPAMRLGTSSEICVINLRFR